MQKIRYTQRICQDQEVIEHFLRTTRVGIVAMIDTESLPYATPVNFVWYKGALYFHGMGSGKKESILSQNPSICFTLFHEFGTTVDPMPCHADTSYRSAMIFGKVFKVDHSEEAAEVLQCILDKYTPDYYKTTITSTLVEKYRSSHDGKAVSVFKVLPYEITVKENCVPEDQLFNK